MPLVGADVHVEQHDVHGLGEDQPLGLRQRPAPRARRYPSSSRLTRQSSRIDASSLTTSTVGVWTSPPFENGSITPYLFGRRSVYYSGMVNVAPCSPGPQPQLPAPRLAEFQRALDPLATAAAAAAEARERLLLAEQLEALEQTRRDRRAGQGETNRLKRLARLQPEPLGQLA